MKSFLSKQSSKSFIYPYFRSIIPKDLVSNLGGATDFRLSLNYVRQADKGIKIIPMDLEQLTYQEPRHTLEEMIFSEEYYKKKVTMSRVLVC